MKRDFTIRIAENGFVVHQTWTENDKWLEKTYIFNTKEDMVNWLKEEV
jgi:hypothetical protein